MMSRDCTTLRKSSAQASTKISACLHALSCSGSSNASRIDSVVSPMLIRDEGGSEVDDDDRHQRVSNSRDGATFAFDLAKRRLGACPVSFGKAVLS
ncbi:hypothetical protein [Bradyrhizobium retamae]|uniref:Uncharacterized protein n=1 Tax=Bradyrhizobium retamae TaxID=1300035 RepID=A0A0R3N3S3_9BRAD|nr:hypothetical protein [Bradyrhizobium retamae]KRR27047.1 hypothetical protein CQ13_39740 [Bradyrhizobium retamae]